MQNDPAFHNLRQRRGQQRQSSSRERNARDHRRRGQARSNNNNKNNPLSWKRQLGLVAVSIVLYGIWYLTPLSDILLELLLEQVPLQADKDLESKSLQQLRVVTHFDAYWTPLILDIGDDLMETLHQSCRRGTSSYFFSQNDSDDNEEEDDLLCRFAQRRDWNFGIVDEPHVVNAFCFPAGTIRITTGLLKTLTPSRGELAALLGHEIGHVLRRHATKRMMAQNVLEKLWQTVNYEDHDGYDETWGEALGELLLDSASWLGQQRFSRRDEYQADAVSWALLKKSTQYTPMALIRLLSQLQSLEQGPRGGSARYATSSWATTLEDWSRTHPATTDRVAALREAWAKMPSRARRKYEARAYS